MGAVRAGWCRTFVLIPPPCEIKNRRGSDERAVTLLVAGGQPGQPKVADQRFAVLVEQDVARLQVAVDHALLMGVVDGAGHRLH